jgi:hypothetical protein
MKKRLTLSAVHAPVLDMLMEPPTLREVFLERAFAQQNEELNKLIFEVRDYLETNGVSQKARLIDDAWWKQQQKEYDQLKKEGRI